MTDPHSTAPLPTRDIMGVAIVAATAAEVIAHLDEAVAAGQGVRLAFLNAHGSNIAARDPDFRRTLKDFMVLNDGIGVDIAARVLHGARFPENLNGTDFVPCYLERTTAPRRLYLLGGQPGVAEAAAQSIRARTPHHEIVGLRDGYFGEHEAGDVIAAIAAARPDVVLVAMGNPVQEFFIARHFGAMGCGVAIGVGALLDFQSGRVSRAPAVFRRLRSEWVYRLALEPRRLWRRYILGNSQFIYRLLRTRLGRSGAAHD